MRSLILTLSYLLKDTWLRWFEQPGSVLARALVTAVMTALSIVLIVGLSLQIKALEENIEQIGLDNVVVTESIPSGKVSENLSFHRFNYLSNWGKLITLDKLSTHASGGGKRVNVVAYGEKHLPSLEAYLNKGHNYFLLSNAFPEGALIDFEIKGQYIKAISLVPDQKLAQVLPENLLFVPVDLFRPLTETGFIRINYLQRAPDAPSLKEINATLLHTVATDKDGSTDVRSALAASEQLDGMKAQLRRATFGLSLALGAALALIYGTLSLLEFQQSMYISALLNSFGASKVILFLRTVVENLFIANLTALGLIYTLSRNHTKIAEVLKHNISTSPELIKSLYWGESSITLIVFINIGVLLACFPVFLAMRKQVGRVLS